MERIEILLRLSEEEITIETIANNSAKKDFWKGRASGLRSALSIIKDGRCCDSCGKQTEVHTYCDYCAENYY